MLYGGGHFVVVRIVTAVGVKTLRSFEQCWNASSKRRGML